MSPFPAEPINTASSGSVSGAWSPVDATGPLGGNETSGSPVPKDCGCRTEGPHCHCLREMPHKVGQVGNGIACEQALAADDLGLMLAVKPFCFDTKEKRDWPHIAERQAHKVAQAVLASDWLAARTVEAEQRVRAEIADELAAMAVAGRALYPTDFQQGIERGMENAARIARGGTQ